MAEGRIVLCYVNLFVLYDKDEIKQSCVSICEMIKVY